MNQGAAQDRKNSSMRRRHNSMIVRGGKESQKWLQEYSGFNLQEIQESLIMHLKNDQKSECGTSMKSNSQISSISTQGLSQLNSKLVQHEQVLQSLYSFDFDAFKVSDAVGRENCFTMAVFKMMNELPMAADDSSTKELNKDKLVNFLKKIGQGYRREVDYHNELHGLDVAQMMFLMINKANLGTVA